MLDVYQYKLTVGSQVFSFDMYLWLLAFISFAARQLCLCSIQSLLSTDNDEGGSCNQELQIFTKRSLSAYAVKRHFSLILFIRALINCATRREIRKGARAQLGNSFK